MSVAGKGATVIVVVLLAAMGCVARSRSHVSSHPPAKPTDPRTRPQAAPGSPALLRGEELRGPTKLRLLIASDPPVLLDVDTTARRPITGLPEGKDKLFSLQAAGRNAVITSNCGACGPNAGVFVVRHGTTTARRIGSGSDVAPSHDGRGIWLKTYKDTSQCTLAEVSLSGLILTAPRPLSCRLVPRTDTALGLLVAILSADRGDHEADGILAPGADWPRVRAPQIYAVAGRRVLTSTTTHGALLLSNESGNAHMRIPRPATIGESPDGLVSPDGRYVAIPFSNPACPGPQQCLDVWLLDLASRQWHHMPSMPALAP